MIQFQKRLEMIILKAVFDSSICGPIFHSTDYFKRVLFSRQKKVYTIDRFHIVYAHACIGHVSRYFSIIHETSHRWSKRILSH